MKAELATLAVSLLVGMSTCSVSVWSYDKASPEERVAFLTKEALKLAGRNSVRQQDFARIFDVRPNANARSVSVQILLSGALDKSGSNSNRNTLLRRACADYVRSPLRKNKVEVGVVLRSATGVLSMADMKDPYKVMNHSSSAASFRMTPQACERALETDD
ncbi:MAG TPA: hypothetical protein PLR76_08720 [Hyphomonas sp.]|nr:hypothetical protein [Hyphomonas sp.]MCA8906254.1 hypothetical protein [Hyphomonas sp.]MCB9972250.1 hypothetical protein [Hyphomonas sp.]HPE48466.1 hypothetical protein [Hyphomonas sp.]